MRYALRLVLLACFLVAWTLPACQTTDGGNGLGTLQTIFQAPRRGETWTIFCTRIAGEVPDHEARIEALADALRRVPGLDAKRVTTRHDTDESSLFYGSFRPPMRNGDPAFTPEDRQQVSYISSLALGAAHPFLEAQLVPSPTEDVGPSEWNINQCAGPYTLAVAEYYNADAFTERKEAAVAHCRILREKGYPAYYHHGLRRSLVCVGAYRKGKDFQIRSDGIYLGLAMRTLTNSDPELLKYKHANGSYSLESMNGVKVRQHSMPIPLPNRPPPAEEPARVGRYGPLRR